MSIKMSSNLIYHHHPDRFCLVWYVECFFCISITPLLHIGKLWMLLKLNIMSIMIQFCDEKRSYFWKSQPGGHLSVEKTLFQTTVVTF